MCQLINMQEVHKALAARWPAIRELGQYLYKEMLLKSSLLSQLLATRPDHLYSSPRITSIKAPMPVLTRPATRPLVQLSEDYFNKGTHASVN